MLSKQVKLRIRANRAYRKLGAKKDMRPRLKLARDHGCTQQLLSSKHLVQAEARVDAWSDHVIMFSDGAVIKRSDLPQLEQQKLTLIEEFSKSCVQYVGPFSKD